MAERRGDLQQLTLPGEGGLVVARRVGLLQLREIARARSLQQLLRIWVRAKLRRGALPGYLPVDEIRDCQMLHNFHVYDVTQPDLLDTFASIWGTHAVIYEGTSHAASTIRSIQNDRYRDWVLATLMFVKTAGIPYLEEVAAHRMPKESDTSKSRYRLLLPLSSDGRTVERIIMAWVYVQPSLTPV